MTVLAVSAGWASEPGLHALEPIDHLSVVCGCEFFQSIPGAEEGSYGSSPDLVVLDPNATPARAIVNLGKGNTDLHLVSPRGDPLYECRPGETFESVWSSDEAVLRLDLTVLAPGEEACWFSGQLETAADGPEFRVPVKGACGC